MNPIGGVLFLVTDLSYNCVCLGYYLAIELSHWLQLFHALVLTIGLLIVDWSCFAPYTVIVWQCWLSLSACNCCHILYMETHA